MATTNGQSKKKKTQILEWHINTHALAEFVKYDRII